MTQVLRLGAREQATPTPHQLSASEAVGLIRSGRLTARQLAESCLVQVHRYGAPLHVWAHVDDALVRRQADAVDSRLAHGTNPGPLSGIPVGVKDIFNTCDMPTQMGSPLWNGFTPGNDARSVFSLRQAGAVALGKTVTAEFAVHASGGTVNPHRPGYAPGTSSSGSAVAVASHMAPLALGTQTAGSIIRPASYCGIYGYKPSFGCIPRTGTLKTTDSLDTIGFFARTVPDVRLLFEVLRVRGPDYPVSHAALSDPKRQDKGNRPWRVAVVEHPKWALAKDYAKRHLEEFAKGLESVGGFEIHRPRLPRSLDQAHDVHATIYDRTLAYYFKDEFEKRTLISPIMYEIVTRGNRVTIADYHRALDRQAEIAHELDAWLQAYDVVLTLSTAGQALKGLDSMDIPDSCLIWTLCHLPALNVPAFQGPDGLPFGLQVVARRYNDFLLLKFAEEIRERGLVPDAPHPAPDLDRHLVDGGGGP